MGVKPRRNGFTPPFDLLQIVSFVLGIYFVCVFYAFLFLLLPSLLSIVAVAVESVLMILMIVGDLYCTLTDPADTGVKTQCYHNSSISDVTGEPRGSVGGVGGGADRESGRPPGNKRYCVLCKTYVDKEAKHCRVCRKCVSGFDHHCRWLNNCVAKGTNYNVFFVFLVVTLLYVLIHWSLSLYLFVEFFTNGGEQRDRIDAVYDGWEPIIFEVVWGVSVLLGVACMYMLVDLIIFHIKLLRRGITTYQFILEARQRVKEYYEQLNSARAMAREARRRRRRESGASGASGYSEYSDYSGRKSPIASSEISMDTRSEPAGRRTKDEDETAADTGLTSAASAPGVPMRHHHQHETSDMSSAPPSPIARRKGGIGYGTSREILDREEETIEGKDDTTPSGE
eukprot:TRINITY_DN45845_c0_g1_i1.p1 TRINITY_DN45845_c0_g1~~TRINITY_DN45845_c0_g1_i1.p1  ORF type:complete len:443 (+),score=94.36 TRINITY_DN45845_c0_g1_i1:140-1330(+)